MIFSKTPSSSALIASMALQYNPSHAFSFNNLIPCSNSFVFFRRSSENPCWEKKLPKHYHRLQIRNIKWIISVYTGYLRFLIRTMVITLLRSWFVRLVLFVSVDLLRLYFVCLFLISSCEQWIMLSKYGHGLSY